MAGEPQGLIFYAGIQGLLHGNFTLGLGSIPSVATLYIPPQNKLPPPVASMMLSYGAGTLTFPDCRIIDVDYARDEEGREIWALYIADHRWRWRFGTVNGEYNIRLDDQQFRNDTTPKRPQELARLCFEAMGEPRANVSLLPNDQFPEVQWEYTRADHALEALLAPLNCAVRMLPGNIVSIVRMNEGQPLPDGGDVLFGSNGLNPAEIPDTVRFVGGRTLWQHDFELEPVGKEKDGRIVPIDRLSYKPKTAGGWLDADLPFFNSIKDRKLREYARDCILKWYRIKTPVTLPGTNDRVQQLWRILPITDRQIEKTTVTAGTGQKREETLPAWVWGKYYEGHTRIVDNIEHLTGDLKINIHPELLYTRGYSIDTERGIVMFADHVFSLGPVGAGSGGRVQPAKMFLRTSVGLRDEKTHGWVHATRERNLGQRVGTKPLDLVHDDIALQYHRRLGDGQLVNNKKDIDKFADYYLDAAVRTMQTERPAVRVYAGFKAIPPDGLTRQVTWSIDSAGFARTHAASQTEWDKVGSPSYKDNVFNQRVHAALKKLESEPKEGKRGRLSR